MLKIHILNKNESFNQILANFIRYNCELFFNIGFSTKLLQSNGNII